MGRSELDKVRERITSILPQMCGQKKVEMIFVMLTDIMTESTRLVCYGEDAIEIAQEAFICEEVDEDSVLVRGMVSRKKQLIPGLMKTLTERLN